MAAAQPSQRPGGARRRRVDGGRQLAGPARPDSDRGRADPDRSPGSGHHGGRLRPGWAEPRRPADSPSTRTGRSVPRCSTRPPSPGIGTMYMAEALFVQKASPWTPIGEVDVPALLATARRQLLRGATQAMPTTTGNPRRGMETWVHGRSGRPCQRCGTTVRVAPIGPPLEGADGVLLSDVPAWADAHRRRTAAEPAGCQSGCPRGPAAHRVPAPLRSVPADPAGWGAALRWSTVGPPRTIFRSGAGSFEHSTRVRLTATAVRPA